MHQLDSPSPSAVRAHLDHVLASSAFRGTKRSQEFLRYVVEKKLVGRAEELKERSIALEVFHRPSSYDPSVDSIVRVNANDIRKRLAEYYVDSDSEIRIQLPPGSYVPEFKFADLVPPRSLPLGEPKSQLFSARILIVSTLALLTVVGLSILAWNLRLSRRAALDQFWSPLTASSGEPIILVGTGGAVIFPRGKEAFTSAEIRQLPNKNVALGDCLAAFAVATQLQRVGRVCQLKLGTQLSLEEMQSHPVIAIGMFNNPWTLQLNRDVRFVCQMHTSQEPEEYLIVDKWQPVRQWKVLANPLFPWEADIDYALITRLINTTTHQVFVSAGGTTVPGTQAAAEFLVTPLYWEKLAAQAPPDWGMKNLQVVLEVTVVDGTPKPPVIVASHFW
ncbi:MAG: hypothetical protein LAP13_09125 [Acidobacteriia bacterium]|nr:hypothetical protein [Terriglobia bacterium]